MKRKRQGMTALLVVTTVSVLIHFASPIGLSASREKVFQELIRKRRSIKDALPKDDEFSQSRAIVDMRHKIFSLETSMRNVYTEMEKMSEQTTGLEEEIVEQKALMEKMVNEFGGVQKALETHADILGDLGRIVSPTDNLYALSNQSCGGVLVAQSGSIVFSGAALRGVRLPSTCIWTIQANNREKIKISTHVPFRSYGYTSRQYGYVVELNNSLTNGPASIQTTTTRLQRNMHHVFSGPLLFVVYPLSIGPTDDYSELELNLQYEGMGKLVEKNTFFSHKSLFENSGSFMDSQLESWRDDYGIPENATYEKHYTTLVVSNFSTKVHLQAILGDGNLGCSQGDSFVVITELLENNTAFTDCCSTNCEGRNSLVNYDNPFVILITKKFGVPLKFNIEWVAETPYPSSSRGEVRVLATTYKCGEVLGGVSGSILYKPHLAYLNGERCIWVIVPQPRPRSSIVISVGANGVENTYDHLYMMELTDVNGTSLTDGPKITRLGRYGSYEAYSREVYIVFYSDSSVTGYGFSLSWKSAGAVVKTGNDVTTRFSILKHDDGAAQTKEMKPLLTNGVYEVFLLTPVLPYSYVFGMQLHINQTNPVAGPRDCINQDVIKVYSAQDGIISKAEVECNDPGKAVIENADGLAMIIVDNHDADSTVSMNFSWKQEFGDGNDSYISVDSNHCGGVIKGSKGMLRYKIGFDYLNNERCVWLLHSPDSTSITLKLIKDGFETCCDFIVVNTIEPTTGMLRNDTVKISRLNRTHTFEESMLVIAFQSDGSTRGRGFALQFASFGEPETPSIYRYQMHHYNEPIGEVSYPSSEWEDPVPGVQDIILIASSIKIGADEDPLIMPSNISWTGGLFRNAWGNCSYDSITFYSTPEPAGWKEREKFPNVNDTLTCPHNVEVPKKNDIFSTVFSAFLVVYKPLMWHSQEEIDNEENQFGMGFSFEKSAGCGGVIVADSGEISYKEDGRYSNLEKCVWLVQAPQAQKIRFWLERSGFEECCDILIVHSIDSVHATPANEPSIISQSNRTAVVDGPVAIVTFSSDSSVVGEGFRLSFTTHTQTTSDFPVRYHLDHRNKPRRSEFVFEVEPNEVVIVAYNPEIHRQSYQGSGSTEIVVSSFRPQVDEQCQSDKLKIYDVVGGRERGLVMSHSFSALDVVKEYAQEDLEGNCTHLRDSNYQPCTNIVDCGDAPENNKILSDLTAFLVIYQSINVTDDGLTNRGFVMESKITFPESNSTTTT